MSWHDIDKLTTVAQSQSVLRQLEQQHADLRAQLDRTNAQREKLAFAALTEKSGATKKRLDELTRAAMRLAGDIENVRHAIEEARRRIAEAVAAEQRAARCADAERALELKDELRQAGTLAGEALEAFTVRYLKVQQIAAELHALEIGFPRADLIRVNVERAIATAVGPIGLAPLLPPAQRCTIPSVIERYATDAEAMAHRILNGEHGEEAA